MEYKILWDSKPDDLTKEVNELIEDGWKPQGGVSITVQYDANDEYPIPEFYFAQAMVRDEDEDDEDQGEVRGGYGSTPSSNREPRW